jgi:hypothetical protein
MERTGGEPDVIGHDKKRAHTFFMIVQRKVLKTAEVFATTVKRWSQGKNTNQRPSKKWLQLLDSREISGAPKGTILELFWAISWHVCHRLSPISGLTYCMIGRPSLQACVIFPWAK